MNPLDKALACFEEKRTQAIKAIEANERLSSRYTHNFFHHYDAWGWMELYDQLSHQEKTWPLTALDEELKRIAEPLWVAAKVIHITALDGPEDALQFKLQWSGK